MSRNVFTDRHTDIRGVSRLIEFAARNKKAILILGASGIGKSDRVRQAARNLFGDAKDTVCEFRLSDKEPPDVRGHQIPARMDDGTYRTIYAVPDFWPSDPNWKGIIFFDELPQADGYMQKVAMQMMLDRCIGDFPFPEGAVLVGAGNRVGDGSGAEELFAALANRMIIVEADVDSSIWLEDYAIPNGIHPAITGLIAKEPSAIENYEEQCVAHGCPSFTSPRSLATASCVLYEQDAGTITGTEAGILLQGSIGPIATEKVIHIQSIRKSGMPDIKDVLSGVKTDGKHLSHDAQFMVASEGSFMLRKEVMADNLSDEQIVERAAHFLDFMYKNYGGNGGTNSDLVMSTFRTFIDNTSAGKGILRCNPRREKLIARLANKYPVTMEIVKEYTTEYAEAVNAANGK